MKSTRKKSNLYAPQAIVTRYLAPTDTLPGRIKASCERGSIILAWSYGLDIEANHQAAVDALIARFVTEDKAKYGTGRNPWARGYVLGALPKSGFVAVFI